MSPRRVQEVVAGGSAAVVAFGAVPAVLVALVGVPFPARWDQHAVLSAHGLFDVLAVVAWLAWSACAWPLLRSVVGHVRRREATAPTGARLTERLAVRIAAAVLALAPVGAAATTAGASLTGTAVPTPIAAAPPAPSPSAGPASSASGPAPAWAPEPDPVGVPTLAGQHAAVPVRYTVAPGDTLWSIAQQAYGEGADWPAIAAANLGMQMPDGSTFVDPALIRPGWVLRLPTPGGGTAAPPSPAAAAGTPAPAAPPPPSTESDPPAPIALAPRGSSDARAASFQSPRTAGRGDARAGTVTDARPAGAEAQAAWGTGGGGAFPALAALGFGTVMAGLVARRARRARRLRRLARPEGAASPPVSDAAAEVAAAVDAFGDLPLVDWVELAVRLLTGALESAGRAADAPAVQLLRAAPDGVEARLDTAPDWTPPGWESGGPTSWRLPAGDHHGLVVGADTEPWLPVLLPLGDDGGGTWLLPVEPGSCVAVLGSKAADLVAALRVGAGSWSWAEQVIVTEDPAEVERAAGSGVPLPRGNRTAGTAAVLFVGDPGLLSPTARSRCAVLTTEPVATAGRTVLVDERAATVHPCGVTVHPHLLDAPRAAAVAELLAELPAASEPAVAGSPVPPAGGPAIPWRASAVGVGPGRAAEVRLLVAVPRIDGLQGELPPKRSRRAVELVAYLALHRPDPVTGDRLRTRVLGSEEADAAAKTLFNTAGAARRALGTDPDGQMLLPSATRTGHYRLSPAVTVDAVRAGELAADGCATDDPELAMALLREALGLVEAEPLSGLLTGYAWWQAEGHEQRVADRLVDAACRLGRSAAAAGHVDLARWAVDRGRLVDPYSEALVRVAMEVAAAAGDAARLRQEWLRCVRLVDEVDPGGLPSAATERVYVELRRRLPSSDSAGDGWARPTRAGAGSR